MASEGGVRSRELRRSDTQLCFRWQAGKRRRREGGGGRVGLEGLGTQRLDIWDGQAGEGSGMGGAPGKAAAMRQAQEDRAMNSCFCGDRENGPEETKRMTRREQNAS